MAGGAAYKSPEKSSTLRGKPQAAWNTPGSESQATTDGNGARRPTRRNSIMELLEQHGDKNKQLIDRAGFEELCDELGLQLNAIEKRRAFSSLDTMDGSKDGQLEYSYVHAWVKDKRQMQLRAARQLARKLFDIADTDSSGFLDKTEVHQVERRLVQRCPQVELVPPFDPDKDFTAMDKDGAGHVSWAEFEEWWMSRTGDSEPSCPVLPEAMVTKMDETCEPGLKGWVFLRERLKALIGMQRLWGDIGELYKGSQESLYTQEVLPPFVRGPDSKWTRRWDLMQVAFICWVATVVPYRICFDVIIDLGSMPFWIDAFIDLFFIVDVVLNFRTAYYLPTGFLETDLRQIRMHYLSTWFIVDLVASLPMTYVGLISAAIENKEVTQDRGSRILKATRIIRLAKMLRVARLKRIVGRHASLVEFTAYVNSMFTFVAILYVAHLVACFWYMIGTLSEESWVLKGLEQPVYSGTYSYKYSMSLYTIFKLGEGICYTSEEAVFAFASELTISLIYGALAGVMSTMMMAGSIGEQEYLVKLSQLKAWMKARHLSTAERVKIMGYFSANHQSSTYFDEKKILSYLPLGVARDLSVQLYKTILGESPLFANLGPELMLRVCQCVEPVRVSAGQTVYDQGKVGSEMYFVLSGELEVICDGDRLGFLGQGAFFGENAVIEALDRKPGLGAEVRLRTMKASADSELGMVSASDVLRLCDTFPELEIRMQSFRKAGNKLSEKGHNAREIRELKRRALLRSASTNGSPSYRDRTPSYRSRSPSNTPSYRNSAYRNRSSSTASNSSSAQDQNQSDTSGGRTAGSGQDSLSPLTAEEDARAERVANAAGSLIGLTDGPTNKGDGRSGNSDENDGRPERVQFEGLPGAPDDEIMRADGMLDEEEVPASVYLAVASVSPRATQEQLAAAERTCRNEATDGGRG